MGPYGGLGRHRKEHGLADSARLVAFQGIQTRLFGRVSGCIAADDAVDQGGVEALAALEIGLIGGAAGVRLDEGAQDVLMGEPAVRQARVGIRAPGRRVDRVRLAPLAAEPPADRRELLKSGAR